MLKIVISQPMFFPWIGLFEQIRLADAYAHYDDVQFPLGRSFVSRVEIKTAQGSRWLTVPVLRQGVQLIRDVVVDDSQNWREKHFRTLQTSYARAPFVKEMLGIVDAVYALKTEHLSEINIYATEMIAEFFGISRSFHRASRHGIDSSSSEKLLFLVQRFGGTVYITGHGARNYLDHELFERAGIRVEYMDYRRSPYPQLYGTFDPHVSILDLIANVGRDGIQFIHSSTKYWRDFIRE